MRYLAMLVLVLSFETWAQKSRGGGSTGGGSGQKTQSAMNQVLSLPPLFEFGSREVRERNREKVYHYVRSLSFELRFFFEFYYHVSKVINPEDRTLRAMDENGIDPQTLKKSAAAAYHAIRYSDRSRVEGVAQIQGDFRYDHGPLDRNEQPLTFHFDSDDGVLTVNPFRVFSDRDNYSLRTNVGTWFHELVRILGMDDGENRITANWLKAMYAFYHLYQFDEDGQRALVKKLEDWCKTGPDNIFTNYGYAALSDIRSSLDRFGSDSGGLTGFSNADYSVEQCREAIRVRKKANPEDESLRLSNSKPS